MSQANKISVIGSGYVGLVAAVCFAEMGHDVICVDIDERKVAALQGGNTLIHEHNLPELLERYRNNKIRFMTDIGEAMRQCQVIFIAVGTPQSETGDADLSYVEAVACEIAASLTSYKVIVEKSTVPVYTNEWIRRAIQRNGIPPEFFDVVSNPEFLREGTAVFDFLHPDRIVVGADNERAAQLLGAIYAPLTTGEYYTRPGSIPGPCNVANPPALLFTSTKSAEIIKHASNAFLALKISFINAVSNFCEATDANIEQVARGVGMDSRIGPKFLRPGIGYGGSCFSKDIAAFRSVAEQLGIDLSLLTEVKRINDLQKKRFLDKVRSGLGTLRGKHIGVLGLAFKGETDDIRESPAIEVVEMLLAEGSIITAYDPAAMRRTAEVLPQSPSLRYVDSSYAAAEDADALVILTDWQEFATLNLNRIAKALRYPLVIDGRNIFDPQTMSEHGFTYLSIGRAPAYPSRAQSGPSSSHSFLRAARIIPSNGKSDTASKRIKPQTILVTGAAGFLGSHLSDLLLAEGHTVIGVDDLSTGNLANLSHLANEPRFSLIERDICNVFDPGTVDFIYNLASPASPIDYARLGVETLRVGSAGTINTLNLARKYNAGFLHASTSECYGDPEVHPQVEAYWGHVNPVGPRSVYDEAKRFSEAAVMAYHRYYGVDTRLVRIFNTYGPRLQANDGRVISNFMMQALRGEPLTVYGDGSQTRSFCYVSDLMDGILRLARSSEHMPINIGNPEEWTILESAREVLAVTGSKAEIQFKPLPQDDPSRRSPDITRARTILGWEPKIALREGLKRSLQYFQSCTGESSAMPLLPSHAD